jgi:hypothetical protein
MSATAKDRRPAHARQGLSLTRPATAAAVPAGVPGVCALAMSQQIAGLAWGTLMLPTGRAAGVDDVEHRIDPGASFFR